MTKATRWHPLFCLVPGLYMMGRRTGGSIATALLYVHSFRPLLARTFKETERMIQIDPKTLTETADKLCYHRHVLGLKQKEVAALVGLDRTTYASYESPTRENYPFDKLNALAELFGVPLEYLLDDYHTFLYHGQGKQLRALRESMGLSKRAFAHQFGVWRINLQKWESDSVRMTKETWEKLFKP